MTFVKRNPDRFNKHKKAGEALIDPPLLSLFIYQKMPLSIQQHHQQDAIQQYVTINKQLYECNIW